MSSSDRPMGGIDVALMTTVMFLWGTNIVAVKIGVTQLPPLMLMGLRFAVVAALLLPFVRIPRGYLKPIFEWSVTFGLFHFGLLAVGLQGINASAAAIIIQLGVPFAAIGAAIFLKERPGRRIITGIVVAFFGGILIAGKADLSGDLFYFLIVIVATLGWTVSNFQVKRLRRLDIFTLNAWMALFAAPQLLLASLIFESGQAAAARGADAETWTALAYTVMVVICGHGLWYRLVGRHPMSQVVPFTLLAPMIGVVAGVLFLGEDFTGLMLVGGIMTLTGVALIIPTPVRRTAGPEVT